MLRFIINRLDLLREIIREVPGTLAASVGGRCGRCSVSVSRKCLCSHRCVRTSAPSKSLQDQGWRDIGTQQRAAKGCGKERGGGVYLIKEGKALGLGPLVSNLYFLLTQLEEATLPQLLRLRLGGSSATLLTL